MASSTVAFPSNEPQLGRLAPGRIVERVLETVTSWQAWASLLDELPLLAEAAPDAFLDAVERGLRGETPVLREVFVDGDPIFMRSPHVGLLWGIEVVAWSPEYLSRATLLLGRLARIDPGGKVANRPAKSLHESFCPGTQHERDTRAASQGSGQSAPTRAGVRLDAPLIALAAVYGNDDRLHEPAAVPCVGSRRRCRCFRGRIGVDADRDRPAGRRRCRGRRTALEDFDRRRRRGTGRGVQDDP